MSKRELYIFFSHMPEMGPMRLHQLIERVGSIENIFEASKPKMQKLIGVELSQKIAAFARKFDVTEIIQNYAKQHITIVTKIDPEYPNYLREISDAPACLYCKGDVRVLNNETIPVAIVGSRKPTSYGLWLTERFVTECEGQPVSIISGLAYGIDAAAHRAALKHNVKTIAVLGSGINKVYPAAHKGLYDEIVSSGGVVLSEFPPDVQAQQGLFIARNRIISGISKGVVIIEGTDHSGSLTTARFAANQGREVGVFPMPLNSELSQAPLLLLREGATLIMSAEDFFLAMGYAFQILKKESSHEENKILQVIKRGPMKLDEMSQSLHMEISKLLAEVSLLEIQGKIRKNTEGKYERS